MLATLLFLMLVYQLQYSPGAAFAAAVIVSSSLSLGLAFSTQVRCIVMIALPTLFSSTHHKLFTSRITGFARISKVNVVKT